MDPHDDKAIADALLKLVADKNLWHECRKNGWRNIHLFSWPEHCRTYLTRVAACRMRHPQWQMDTPLEEGAAEESLGDSLKEVQDISLRLSVDGEKSLLNESETDSVELESDGAEGDPVQDQVRRILNKIKKPSSDPDSVEVAKKNESGNTPNKYPTLRRRRRLIVIALDSYDDAGNPDNKMLQIIHEIINAARSDQQMIRFTGFALSTAMPIVETLSFLRLGKIQTKEFDAIICSSGSEVYYPGTFLCGEDDGEKHSPDSDYAAHIDYRWGCDGLKKTISKLMGFLDDKANPSSTAVDLIEEDVKSNTKHCISYIVKDPTKVRLKLYVNMLPTKNCLLYNNCFKNARLYLSG